MSQILSHSHINVVINGHPFTGWADEERPVEFPSGENMVEVKVGRDGGVYGSNIPMFGGEVKFKLAPTSPTTQWAIIQKEAWKQAQINGTPTTVYEGTYMDASQGRTVRLEGGFLQMVPDISEPGQTFEMTIYFERITASVEASRFVAPLASE